jgi:hypothetical protein
MMEGASAADPLRGSDADSHQLDHYTNEGDTAGSSQDLVPTDAIVERTKRAIKLFSEQGEQLEGLQESIRMSISNLQVVCGMTC